MRRRAGRAGRSFATSCIGWSDRLSESSRASGLERFLNLFTVVRSGEARTALLLGANVFLILMAYYILKTVREALILGEGTAELKSYLSAGQVVVLAFVVPVLRTPRVQVSADDVDQHRDGLLRRLSGDLLPAGPGRGGARADLLRVDRRLQSDGRRAVLVVCQRRLHQRRRRAPARDRGSGRVAGCGGGRACGRSSDRAVRRQPVDAAWWRRARPPVTADQLYRPRSSAPADRWPCA